MRLTKNFTLEELTFSQTAFNKNINNQPTPDVVRNLRVLALNLQILRSYIKRPITITSGYRSPTLNEAVGGVRESHHLEGYAADIVCPYLTIAELTDAASRCLIYDQLINEYDSWVHLSVAPDLRMQKLHFQKRVA